jgi:hypothetical protein
MIERALQHFPSQTYGLTLVTDPDNLLSDEGVLAALYKREFTLIIDVDPIQLRWRVAQFGVWSTIRPLIIVTPVSLDSLPYDLWQPGHHVTLALHSFFPLLSYPVVKTLTPTQRWHLTQAPTPDQRLGRRATMDYLLKHVFDAEPDELRRPAGLVAWLNRYHSYDVGSMPESLAERLLEQLKDLVASTELPLQTLLADPAAFEDFLADQWLNYVQRTAGTHIRDTKVPYLLSFEEDESLQDTLPRLLRSGALRPVTLPEPRRLPTWARTGVLAPDENANQRRACELLALLADQAADLTNLRWSGWQSIAWTWAELTALRYHPGDRLEPGQETAYCQWLERLDQAFAVWLGQRYSPLGGQRVPTPHHLHHIPHVMAFQRRQSQVQRVAMLILDGMSLADWMLIRDVWRGRHPDWQLYEHVILAQIPTITAVSRQALISGSRPADFADTVTHNRHEARRWTEFWAREDIPASACAYAHLSLGEGAAPPVLTSARVQALCLINKSIDDMLHGASLGAADVRASLYLWLDEQSQRLEAIISDLLIRGYSVYVTSDHGHTEAYGMGQPSEGLTVETRSKRARVYRNRGAANTVQAGYPDSILWEDDSLLPPDTWVLTPATRDGRRLAFASEGMIVVTHGGLTLDELVVPFIRIAPQTSNEESQNAQP